MEQTDEELEKAEQGLFNQGIWAWGSGPGDLAEEDILTKSQSKRRQNHKKKPSWGWKGSGDWLVQHPAQSRVT